MSTLYELSEDFETVINMLYDEEVDETTILDTLESIEGEIEDKADSYAKLIKSLLADAEAIKAEEKRLAARRKSLEDKAEKIKKTLQANLQVVGKTRFKTALFTYSIRKASARKLALDKELTEIPEEYLIPQPPIVNNAKIKERLKTEVLPFAHLEPATESLIIK